MNKSASDITANALYERLSNYDSLRDEFEAVLKQASIGTRSYAAHEQVWRAGERPKEILLIESGWAFHHQLLNDGGRQICQVLIPGDLIDGAAALSCAVTCTDVTAAGPLDVRRLDPKALFEMLRDNRRMAAALWWTEVQTGNIFREHITRIGRKSSSIALAHFLLEMLVRTELKTRGGSVKNEIACPLTQAEIGDFLGITPVHVSRMLTLLKEAGYLTWTNRRVSFTGRARMEEFADFKPDYLTVGCNPHETALGRPRAAHII